MGALAAMGTNAGLVVENIYVIGSPDYPLLPSTKAFDGAALVADRGSRTLARLRKWITTRTIIDRNHMDIPWQRLTHASKCRFRPVYLLDV